MRSLTTLAITTALLAWLTPSPLLAADSLRFSYLETSHSQGAQEALVVKGGSWWTRRYLSHGAILIEHPAGTLLYDTGLGTRVDDQFAVNSWLNRQLFGYTEPDPVIQQFARHGYQPDQLDAIIPSHLHWDHASGLVDLAGIPIWIRPAELEHARAGEAPAFLQSQLDEPALNWQTISLKPEPFLGFSHSLDVFADGRVVLVDLSGHSAGQLGLYLRLPDEREYLFIGDTSWTLEGVENNRPRPQLPGLPQVDQDRALNDQRLAQVHRLHQQHPELTIVPAHDERVAAGLPAFPQFSDHPERP